MSRDCIALFVQKGSACSCTATNIDPECYKYKEEQARLEQKPLLSKSSSKPRVPHGYVLEPVVPAAPAAAAGESQSAEHVSRHSSTLAAELLADADLGYKRASAYVRGPILRSSRKSSETVRDSWALVLIQCTIWYNVHVQYI